MIIDKTDLAARVGVPENMLFGENTSDEAAAEYVDFINKPRHYIMVNRKPVLINLHQQTRQMIKDRRRKRPRARVRHTYINGALISTVMLTINHGLDDDKPLIYETMIFDADGSVGDMCQRCYTHRQALKQHREIVKEYKNGIKQKPTGKTAM